ncbi:UNVERIFIED_CONTAM: hypothetical protein HDU68_010008 [Siphonaria sp. JEL0065]|nr:hypothetical protein HDU68_010008 [Siphonaria sp. JEL0065]
MGLRSKKILRRLNQSDLVAKARALLDQLGVRNPKNYKPSKDDKIPDSYLFVDLLVAIKNHHTLLKHLVCATRAAYCSCKVVAAQTYFVPLMVSFMAVYARLHQISLSIMADLENSYRSLYFIATKELAITVVTTATTPTIKIDLRDMDPMLSSDLADLFQETERPDLLDDGFNSSSLLDKDSIIEERPLDQGPVETLNPELDMFFSSNSVASSAAAPINSVSQPVAKGKKRPLGIVDEKPKQPLPTKEISLDAVQQKSKKLKADIGIASPSAKSKPEALKAAVSKNPSKVAAKPKANKKKLSADEIDAIFGL